MDHYARSVTLVNNESANFPILCETCLGPNPLVRMIRHSLGRECRVCERPFTVFRWKPGPKARYKQTIVCQKCAKARNLCQTCLFDLKYGLPVEVINKFSQHPLELPEDDKNLVYKLDRLDEAGNAPPDDPVLARIARVAPYYRRNRPRVCTFWLRGACNRGAECPYAHEDVGHDSALDDQKIRARYRGVNDPVARKIMASIGAEGAGTQGPPQGADGENGAQEGPDEAQGATGANTGPGGSGPGGPAYPSMDPREMVKRME